MHGVGVDFLLLDRYMIVMIRLFTSLPAGILAVLLATTSASFAASSDWLTVSGGKMRLVTSPSPDGKELNAGLQIKLDDGWKTYWRSPGASGIPPQLSFLGSKNVANAELMFPVPTVFPDGEGLVAGYKNEVTFPIQLDRLSNSVPTTLSANGLVGICSDICIPVQFTLSVTDKNSSGSQFDVVSVLNEAKSNLASNSHDSQYVAEMKFKSEPNSHFAVKAQVPSGAKSAVLHVEGPYNWYLSPVRATSIEGTTAYFQFPLKSLPKNAKPLDTKLKVSLVVDGRGIEQEITPSQ